MEIATLSLGEMTAPLEERRARNDTPKGVLENVSTPYNTTRHCVPRNSA